MAILPLQQNLRCLQLEGRWERSHCGGSSNLVYLILSFSRNEKIRLRCHWQFEGSEVSAVTRLAWSPWVAQSMSANSMFSKWSILAASMDDGSVHLTKVFVKSSKEDIFESCEIDARSIYKLRARDRLSIARLAWKRRGDEFVLAMSSNRGLIASIHSVVEADLLGSRHLTDLCPHKNYSPVAGNVGFISC